MKIIRDREELEGTGYIEVLPGKYLGNVGMKTQFTLMKKYSAI